MIKNDPADKYKTSYDIEKREIHQIKTAYFKRGIIVMTLFFLKNKKYNTVEKRNKIKIDP